MLLHGEGPPPARAAPMKVVVTQYDGEHKSGCSLPMPPLHGEDVITGHNGKAWCGHDERHPVGEGEARDMAQYGTD